LSNQKIESFFFARSFFATQLRSCFHTFADFIRESKYRPDDSVRQIMLVRCTGGSNAVVQFYTKQTDQNNAWSLVFETDA